MGPNPLESVLSDNNQQLRCRKDSRTLRLTRSLVSRIACSSHTRTYTVVVYTVFAHATQSHLDDGGFSASYFLLLSDGSVIFVPVCFLGAHNEVYTDFETMAINSWNHVVVWSQVQL